MSAADGHISLPELLGKRMDGIPAERAEQCVKVLRREPGQPGRIAERPQDACAEIVRAPGKRDGQGLSDPKAQLLGAGARRRIQPPGLGAERGRKAANRAFVSF